MRAISEINDPRLVKALAHPLRVSILAILEDREASPSELADELTAPLGNVSYHVRILSNLNLIKLVRKKPRRGAIEHYYRARGRVRVTDDAWSQVPGIVKEALVDSSLRQASEFAATAAAAGGFDHANAHLTRQALRLDQQGFDDVAALLRRTLDEVQQIGAQSGERLRRSNHDEEFDAGVVMMLFEAAAGGNQVAGRGDSNISRPARRGARR